MDVANRLENMPARYTRAGLISLSLVLTSIIFVVDLRLPLGVAGGVPYIVVVLLSLWSPDRRFAVITAFVCTALTIVGYYYSPSGGILWMVLANRFLAMFGIWTMAVLVLRYWKTVETRRQLATERASLANVGHIINSSLDIEAGFDSFAEKVRRLVPFERLSLTKLDEDLVTCVVTCTKGIPVTGRQVNSLVHLASTRIEHVVITKKGVLFQGDSDLDAEIGLNDRTILKAGLRSFIIVPMISNDRVIATLNFGTTHANAYTQRHLELANSMANLLSGAVANSNLYNECQVISEQLKESEAMYRGLYEDSPAAYFSVGTDGRIRKVNHSGESLTGLGLHDLIDRPIIELYADTPLGKEKAMRLFHQFQAGEKIQGEDLEMLNADGNSVSINLAVHPVVNAKGQILESRSVAIDITERKQAEEKLQESEQKFRSVFRDSAVAMALSDRDGRFIQTNSAMRNMLGYSDEELLSLNINDITYSEDLKADNEIRQRLWAAEIDSIVIHKRYVHKDGHLVWVSLVVSAICEADGSVMHILAQIQNVTERKEAEEKLRLQAAALESAANAIAILDDQRNIIWVNPAFADMFGYTAEEVIGQNISMLNSDEVDPAVSQSIKDTIYAGRVWRGEIVNMRKDGSNSVDETTITPVKNADGKITNFISIKQDITERKLAEEQLRLQAAALESAANAIVITDREGTITWVNGAFTSLTGYTKEEAIGQHTRVLKSGKQDPEFYQSLWDTITSGQVWHDEIINERKDGSVYAEEMTITPIRNADGDITNFIAIKQDITERKHLEAQLVQAQKMESIGTLAGGVAHDFNNMLSAILSYSELASTVIEPGTLVADYLDEIHKAGARSTELTRQLLAFSRRQIFNPEITDLNDLISNLEKMLGRMIGEHIRIEMSLSPNLSSVLVDRTQIEQVLMNMAVNSRDAMPNGGILILETSNIYVDESAVRLQPGLTIGPYVTFKVTDNGAGIPDEMLTHIFEPFYTSKEVGEGTGLGLSMCHGIIAQSEGHIAVKSRLERGTTFTVYLPAIDEIAKRSTSNGQNMAIPKGNESVLLVEDEPIVRRVAMKILSNQGYAIEEATNGQEALEVLSRDPERQFDILITDVVMPIMGGRELVERFREAHPNTQVLYMTGYTDDDIFRQDIFNDNCAIIQKPFTPNTLAQKVREILDGS